MAAASPSGRKRNVTQYDFLDEPVVDLGKATSPSSPFAMPSLKIASPGLRLSRDAGELFHLFFRHNLKPEINFVLREFENKRGPAVQKSMDQAIEVMQLAHKGYANSQQLFDQFGVNALATAKDCCTMIKEQLSKHTNYQEKLLRAEAEWISHREREMNRYAQAHEEDQKAMEAQFAESVLALDERYTAGFEYQPKDDNKDERLKQIRREVLLAQLAIVKKRRADRKASKAKNQQQGPQPTKASEESKQEEKSTSEATSLSHEKSSKITPPASADQQSKTQESEAPPTTETDEAEHAAEPTETGAAQDQERKTDDTQADTSDDVDGPPPEPQPSSVEADE